VLASPFFYSEKDRFVRLAARTRLPAAYDVRGPRLGGGRLSHELRAQFLGPGAALSGVCCQDPNPLYARTHVK
jgi:hypothetical protein